MMGIILVLLGSAAIGLLLGLCPMIMLYDSHRRLRSDYAKYKALMKEQCENIRRINLSASCPTLLTPRDRLD
jgi:hypothetical protein